MMADPSNEDMGNDSDWEDEVQDGLRQLPPGEEGFLQRVVRQFCKQSWMALRCRKSTPFSCDN